MNDVFERALDAFEPGPHYVSREQFEARLAVCDECTGRRGVCCQKTLQKPCKCVGMALLRHRRCPERFWPALDGT